MSDYPKMLYTGTQQDYQYQIADDAERESVLRESDYVDFADLPYLQPSESVGESVCSEDFISLEQRDAVASELIGVKEELSQAQAEITRLNGIIEAGIAENEALRQQLAQPLNIETVESLQDLTSEQLRELITNQGKTFKARDSKAELIAILES